MAAAPHHDWLWLLDSDAFIMDLSTQLEQVSGLTAWGSSATHEPPCMMLLRLQAWLRCDQRGTGVAAE
jgi:hypothetical protein